MIQILLLLVACLVGTFGFVYSADRAILAVSVQQYGMALLCVMVSVAAIAMVVGVGRGVLR